LNPAAVLALADQAGVSLSISAAGTLKAKGGKEPVARLAPLIKEHKDALLAHLKALEQGAETSLGTIASPSMAAEAKPSAPKEQSVLPLQPLQGVPLSDQEREDRAAGLTSEMSRRAAEARVDTLEWLLGLETLTQEQAELVASFRRMDAALISSRGDKPYLNSLGIPRFPTDCEPKYRHWAGGQPLLDTLLELGASDRAIDMRVTMERSPDDWRRWQEIKAQRRK
jgi:hypothetical protein